MERSPGKVGAARRASPASGLGTCQNDALPRPCATLKASDKTSAKPAKRSPIPAGFRLRPAGIPRWLRGCSPARSAGTLAVIVFPAVAKGVVDEALQGRPPPERLVPLALWGLGSFFIRELLNGLRILLNNVFEQKVIFDLRSDLYSHMQRLPLHWFDNRSTGDLMTRILEDVNSVERVLIDGIEQGVIAVLQIAVVVNHAAALRRALDARRPLAGAVPRGGARCFTRRPPTSATNSNASRRRR